MSPQLLPSQSFVLTRQSRQAAHQVVVIRCSAHTEIGMQAVYQTVRIRPRDEC
jgi:hypothetical protein